MLCQKLQCALSDRVVIKSSQFIDDAKRLYGLSDRKLIVCNVWRHYPVYRGPGNGRKLLFFGRLRKYKGLDDIARIAESCPDIEFLVVGSPDNESLPFVEEISKMQNVEVEARLVSDSEMKRSFELASWVLLPYESASQSGVIIDSYKYGKPVIAYSVGAVSSQVVDGKTGFLIPAGDIASFIAAVNHVTSISDEEYESFSKEAYKFGYENYAAESRCVSFAKKFNIELVDEDADRQEACRNVDAHRKAKKART